MKKTDWVIFFKSKRFIYSLIIGFSAIITFLFGKKLLKYYGAKPSKKDKRDYRIASVGTPLPKEFSLHIPPIKDQANISSCVAHSVSYLSESILNKGEFKPFSVGFVYGYRPAGYYRGEGMYPRDAMKTINQLGNVFYKDFPYNEEVPEIMNRVFEDIDSLKTKASYNKCIKYFQLKSNDDIKNCLIKYGPVSIMYPVHDEFMNPLNGRIDVRGLKKFSGYHQVSIYGWKDDYWLMVNSWGINWGNKGTAYVSIKYPWTEAWGFTTDPNGLITQKKTSFLK